jgi:hypothetical protein
MIRIKCPKCDKALGVDDAKAGAVASCPGCGAKFRVPVPKAKAAGPSSAAIRPKSAAPPAPAKPAAPKRPWAGDAHEDDKPYVFQQEPEPSPETKPQRRPIAEQYEDDEDDDEDRGDRRGPRRKKKKRARRGGESSGSGFLVGMVVFALVGLLFAGLGFVFWPLGFVAVAIGGIGGMIGGIWFLVVAFQEDILQGILCLFVPFYSLYFLITRLEEAGKPFLLNVVGSVLMGIGFVPAIAGLALYAEERRQKSGQPTSNPPGMPGRPPGAPPFGPGGR